MSLSKKQKQGFQDKNAGFDQGFTPAPAAEAKASSYPACGFAGSGGDPALVSRHAGVPVCRTFHGCIEHVSRLSLGDRWQLAYALQCDPNEIPRKLYHLVQGGAC